MRVFVCFERAKKLPLDVHANTSVDSNASRYPLAFESVHLVRASNGMINSHRGYAR